MDTPTEAQDEKETQKKTTSTTSKRPYLEGLHTARLQREHSFRTERKSIQRERRLAFASWYEALLISRFKLRDAIDEQLGIWNNERQTNGKEVKESLTAYVQDLKREVANQLTQFHHHREALLTPTQTSNKE